ncbi:hypothetical protein CgunFtcFv8_002251 [Champsocephalus gunnari]|uniref:Uncharacterized protein n=1 Tax=Champsocephalus gunnari TaxID=52237 RepID=A0AAN8H875_CHAGU|nr:hypothetical protein CgunFtcFv8_002251 [Champsocephalus gunnari]
MSLSWACRKSVEALHLLLDAGRLWDFDLHIQREKEEQRERQRSSRQHCVYPKQRRRATVLTADRPARSSTLGPKASMY